MAAREQGELAAFASTLGFPLDPFQVESCEALEAGHGVLVAAPTGAGKTVVGEFAVHLAMATGRKAFYTTPIKALSNQKYVDLVRRHGARNVGLLTGDSSINGEAPIVVMTTEVLRNMMYAGSPTLVGLGYVVMDEVHYLADRFRGAVWEEVIIHLPPEVRLVSLSATVSNAEEFGAWLAEVRGDVSVVVSEHRPVPLWQHMMVGKGMYDLFVDEAYDPSNAPDGGVDALRDAAPTRVNPQLLQAIANLSRRTHDNDRFPSRGRGRRGPAAVPAAVRAAAGWPAPPVAAAAAGPAGARPAPRSSNVSSARRCCPRSRSSSAGSAARPRSASCWPRTSGWSPTRRASGSGGSSRNGCPASPTRTSASSATGTSSTASPAGMRPTTPACCRPSARWSRSSSPRAASARSSRPRRWPSGSTCPRAPWCSSGWSSSTARPTST